MPRDCSICVHTSRASIETALRGDPSYRDIAKQFEVSHSSLFRHKEHMAPATELPADLECDSLPESPDLTFKQRDFAIACVGEADGVGVTAARLAGYAETMRHLLLLHRKTSR